MKTGGKTAIATLFSLFLCEPLTALAAQEQCVGVEVDASAPTAAEQVLACSAAADALKSLERCGIYTRRRVDLHVLGEIRNGQGDLIFGYFDPFRQRALVTRLTNIPQLVSNTPYAVLPHGEFHRSLIIHEVVHAVMHQNLKRPATSHAAHEYPAYALQIESLPTDLREQFMQSFDQQAVTTNMLFSDPVLLFDPYFFAARAYSHFKAADDGCAHIRALLEGDADFVVSIGM